MFPKAVVIPCAGQGSRWFPITMMVPKELLPIGTRPAIQYVVEEAAAAGAQEIVLVCHRTKLSIAEYFEGSAAHEELFRRGGKIAEWKRLRELADRVRFRVIYQEKPKGLGDAILCAAGAVGEQSFCVILPDDLIFGREPTIGSLVRTCVSHNGWGVLLKEIGHEQVSSYGIIDGQAVTDGLYTLRRAVEKPSLESAPSRLAIVGRYYFPPRIFSLLSSLPTGALGEIQLTDAINHLARETPGYGMVCRDLIHDIGTPAGFAQAQQAVQAVHGNI
ncbi:MAG: NTP transferase domain-containing protein [Deltaproteobacteria bacterium]|nr:NTP transferase domain-containing protein [Deltaproteobacteria bacterium]